MATYVKGSQLNQSAQRQALAQFVHRFTGEHRPAWVNKGMPNGGAYPLQFTDDKDWLNNTEFAVNKNGDLNKKVSYCESKPTWPNNPELRK